MQSELPGSQSWRASSPACPCRGTGKATRYRLNRGRDRVANNALHMMSLDRLEVSLEPRSHGQPALPKATASLSHPMSNTLY